MRSKYQKLITIYFIILSICAISFLHRNYISFHSINFAEWLINYQGSFVRRGIIGEINYNLSKYLSLNLFKITFITQVFFFFTFYFFSGKFILNYKNHFFLLILAIFSPIGFLFPLAELESLGRKEIFYLAFLSFYLFFISLNKKVFLSQFLLIFFLPIILLAHEGMIFFYSYLFIANFFYLKKSKVKNYYLINSCIGVYIIIVFIISYFNFNTTYNSLDKLCNSLGEYLEFSKCIEINGFYKITENPKIIINQFFEHVNLYGVFSILKFSLFSIFGFIPLFLLINNKKIINFFNFKLKPFHIILICLLMSFPIYIAIDWGRWTHINYLSTLFLIIYLIKIKVFSINKNKIYKYLENLKFYKKFLIFVSFCLWWNLKILLTDDIGNHSAYHLIRKTIIYLVTFL